MRDDSDTKEDNELLKTDRILQLFLEKVNNLEGQANDTTCYFIFFNVFSFFVPFPCFVIAVFKHASPVYEAVIVVIV